MKKLYIISYYFAPLGRADGINRSYLVRYLSELGWNIEVISCANPHGFMRNFQKDQSLMKIIPSDVRLHPVQSFYWGPFGNIAAILRLIPDPFLNWRRPAVKKGRDIVSSPGIIYAVAPPLINILVADEIAKNTGMPLVIDLRDNLFGIPEKTIPQIQGMVASTPFSLKEMLRHYGIDSRKRHVMYNGFPDDAVIQTLDKSDFHRNELKIVYAGLINLDQDPAILIRAIKLLEKRHPDTKGLIQTDFFGPKNYYTRWFLKPYLDEQFRFHGYIPFNEVVKKIASSDMAFSSLRGTRKSRGTDKSYCIPSKVYQYIATETPIFAVGPPGALSDLIRNEGIGLFAPFSDIGEQADMLYSVLTQRDMLMPMRENIRKLKPKMAMRTQVSGLDQYLTTIYEDMKCFSPL